MRASLRSANEEAVSHLTQALKLLRNLPDASVLTKDELQLLMALGVPLVQVQGYRSPEVERTYTRAQALIREVGEELPRLELSFWGSFAYYFARGKSHDSHEVAELLVGKLRAGGRDQVGTSGAQRLGWPSPRGAGAG